MGKIYTSKCCSSWTDITRLCRHDREPLPNITQLPDVKEHTEAVHNQNLDVFLFISVPVNVANVHKKEPRWFTVICLTVQ